MDAAGAGMSSTRAAPAVVAPLARNVKLVLVLVLLAATTVAFVAAERLKLGRAPITSTHVTKMFAPECECDTHLAEIRFRLRRADTLTVEILGKDGDVVRTLLSQVRLPAGNQSFTWDGRDTAGALVPEGSYRPRVELERAGRTITLPNPIRVDRTAPSIRLLAARPTTISPDGDGRGDGLALRYRQSERGRPILLVDGQVRVRALFSRPAGTLHWYGKVDGRPLPAGTYRLLLTTRDVAGNLARRGVRVALRVRYVELARKAVRVRAGARFAVGVSTDARRFHWRLGGRTGTAAPPTLRLRAPQVPGRYTLVVTERGHRAAAAVFVRPK